MRRWQIYALKDPATGVVRYVGVTFRPRQRLNEHLSKARKGGRTHRDCWIRSLLSKGLTPTVIVLESGTGAWRAAERRWIAHHRATSRLVNHTDGGEGTPGYVPTAELREKWSRVRRGRKYAPGQTRGMLGKTHSPEARAKIADASRRREWTEESRAKLSAMKRGVALPTHVMQRSIDIRRGKPLSAEHKAKIAATTTNRKPVICVETGETFASITSAARALGVTEASIGQAVRKGCRCRGNHWRLA